MRAKKSLRGPTDKIDQLDLPELSLSEQLRVHFDLVNFYKNQIGVSSS